MPHSCPSHKSLVASNCHHDVEYLSPVVAGTGQKQCGSEQIQLTLDRYKLSTYAGFRPPVSFPLYVSGKSSVQKWRLNVWSSSSCGAIVDVVRVCDVGQWTGGKCPPPGALKLLQSLGHRELRMAQELLHP